jgi:glycosyltransferase involved in cell wall biosynthesis
MENLLVTIIVPVYNSEKLLEDCLRSILAQTHRKIELILIDDGSKDGSGAICDAIAAEDDRVRVFHKANGGIGSAQNVGLENMRGEYVTFCDNDDLVSPYLIQRLLFAITDTGSDMSQCRWMNIGASKAKERFFADSVAEPSWGRVVSFERPAEKYQNVFSKLGRLVRKDGEYYYFNEANWCKLYRAALWEGLRFPEGMTANQDVYIATELYLRMRRAVSCPEVLYYWLQHGDSVTHTLNHFDIQREFIECTIRNAEMAAAAGIFPRRSFYMMITTLKLMKQTARNSSDNKIIVNFIRQGKEMREGLGIEKRLSLSLSVFVRSLENVVYSLTVHKRK